MVSRRSKTVPKESDKSISEADAMVDSITEDKITNGECEASEESSRDEPCSLSEEPARHPEGKGRGELKSPRVLEVSSLAYVSLIVSRILAVRL